MPKTKDGFEIAKGMKVYSILHPSKYEIWTVDDFSTETGTVNIHPSTQGEPHLNLTQFNENIWGSKKEFIKVKKAVLNDALIHFKKKVEETEYQILKLEEEYGNL